MIWPIRYLQKRTPSLYCEFDTHTCYKRMQYEFLLHALLISSGVYLSLRGDIIPNHGYVVISDIGSSMTDTDSLLCITDGVADADGPGNWFAPDGTRVNSIEVPGVRRNRGSMVVRLFRNTADTRPPAEGIYHCMAQDATSAFQTVYVGLYNNGGGNCSGPCT